MYNKLYCLLADDGQYLVAATDDPQGEYMSYWGADEDDEDLQIVVLSDIPELLGDRLLGHGTIDGQYYSDGYEAWAAVQLRDFA